MAICYEISVPAHAALAFTNDSRIYVASVAKFNGNIDNAIDRLEKIASDYSMTVLMSNSIGRSDGNMCAGKSSVWNKKGSLIGQFSDLKEGIVMIDTEDIVLATLWVKSQILCKNRIG
ncbi:MAG: hypothetical protein R3222_00600 [Balneolaceae bacterium]|nr:hypothetical protein [Balneolaceae bacterium]